MKPVRLRKRRDTGLNVKIKAQYIEDLEEKIFFNTLYQKYILTIQNNI
jgi:hypothetical protein